MKFLTEHVLLGKRCRCTHRGECVDGQFFWIACFAPAAQSGRLVESIVSKRSNLVKLSKRSNLLGEATIPARKTSFSQGFVKEVSRED